MKKHKLIIACTIVSAFMLAGCSSKEDTQAIAELQSTVDDLQSQLDEYSDLESELDSANKSIEEMQSQLEAITAEKNAMASKLEALYYIEAMDETMYVISEADIYDNLYDGLLENEATGTISAEQEIKVTGKSNIIDWYEIDIDGIKKYINASLVSEAKPSQQSSDGNTGNTASTGNTGSQSSGGGQTTQQPSGGSGQTTQPSGDTPTQQEIQDILDELGGFGGTIMDPEGGNGWNNI